MARQMKNSGIEWVGDIPAHWQMVKINSICSTITDYVASGSFASLAENVQYLDEPDYAMLVRTMDVSGKGYSGKPVYINQHAYEFLANSNLFGGEIMLPNIGASVGDVYIVPKLYERMSLAPNSIMLRTTEYDKFIYYYFYCDAGRMSLLDIAQSTAQPKFNKTDFRQLRVALPTKEEQQKIVKFLDGKCAEIDDIIQKTKATIEEYKKLKLTLITNSIVKGIRGTRPMKDSGIDWIGNIPADWKVRKGKWILSRLERPVKEDDGVITCFRDGEVTLRSNRREDGFTISIQEIGYQGIEPGDLVVHGMDGFAGAIGISDSRGKGTPVLSVLDSTENKKYIMYYLRNMAYNGIFLALSTGIRVRSCDTNWNKLKDLPYLVPSIDEQQEIADYLDKKCVEIDTLIEKKTALLAEMETYKKSVIYECVTGKKEVL